LTEQVLDVKGSLRILRRFWRTVAVVVLLGVVLAGGYRVLRPPQYHATSLVLLPTSSSGTTAGSAATKNGITTDARIATSAAVLGPAGREVGSSLSVSALEQRVQTSADATGVLGITATAPTARQADLLANAVAGHLVDFVTTNASTAGSDALTGLQAEASQLDRQLADVQKELTAANQRLAADGITSSAGQQDSDLVGKLTSAESSLNLQLDTVKSQIAQTKLGQISANQGTEVIQRATNATNSSLTSLVMLLSLGALGGLLVGSLLVLVLRRRDPRLWSRDDLAGALGLPVMLSLSAAGKRTTEEWATFLKRYQPSSMEQWSVRRALRELGVGQRAGSILVMIALDGDLASVAQAVKVAIAAADSGLSTLLTVTGDENSVASLEAVCMRFGTDGHSPRPGLRVESGSISQGAEIPDLRVIVLVINREKPILPELQLFGASAVLSVSAGYASGDELARVAVMAADHGAPLKGVLVANPSSRDQTVGQFPAVKERGPRVLQQATIRGSDPRVAAEWSR